MLFCLLGAMAPAVDVMSVCQPPALDVPSVCHVKACDLAALVHRMRTVTKLASILNTGCKVRAK